MALALLALLAASVPAAGAAGASHTREMQRYQQERTRCMAIRVHGPRANCLSEASTAHQAALPAVEELDPARYARYARNALERCKPLPEGDRQDCVLRMTGHGTTSGSVSGGGIYRELITRGPSQPAPGR
jgi:hypothetical protein